MSKYAIRRGHQRTGNDGCAEDILNEIDVVNAYYPYIISGLKSLGHEVLDVTPPEDNRTLSNSLMYGINQANEWGADYFISCHANSCDRTSSPVGCEVLYLGGSTKGWVMADNVNDTLVDLGFKDRGAKEDVRGLAELKRTTMPAIIIEPFFISSQADVDLFNKIGAAAIGNAIVKGLTGQSISTTKLGWNPSNKGWWYCTDVDMGYYYRDDWELINGQWYRFDKNGYALQSTWYKGDLWYYLNTNGDMARSCWRWIDGECYCFNPSGGLYVNTTTPDGYKVDETGAWVQ